MNNNNQAWRAFEEKKPMNECMMENWDGKNLSPKFAISENGTETCKNCENCCGNNHEPSNVVGLNPTLVYYS